MLKALVMLPPVVPEQNGGVSTLSFNDPMVMKRKKVENCLNLGSKQAKEQREKGGMARN